ncbi:hypothetical protein Hanom_Chr03g00197711 [Helianthus anomalus]
MSSRLTPYPSFWFALDKRGWEEGKGIDKKEAVTGGSSPSHHHHDERGREDGKGRKKREAVTGGSPPSHHHNVSIWCVCFVGFLTSI